MNKFFMLSGLLSTFSISMCGSSVAVTPLTSREFGLSLSEFFPNTKFIKYCNSQEIIGIQKVEKISDAEIKEEERRFSMFNSPSSHSITRKTFYLDAAKFGHNDLAINFQHYFYSGGLKKYGPLEKQGNKVIPSILVCSPGMKKFLSEGFDKKTMIALKLYLPSESKDFKDIKVGFIPPLEVSQESLVNNS